MGKTHALPGDGNLKQRKDGRWEYRVVVGMDADMKPIRKSFYSRDKSGAAAKKQYRDWLANQSTPIEQVKTVKQWAEYWLDTYKKDQVAYKSYRNYCLYVNQHIIPALGHLKLEDVRAAHIVKLYQDKVGLSASAKRHISIALNGIFDTAIDNHLCSHNPCQKAKMPKTPKKKPQAWSMDRVAQILDFAPQHEYGPMVEALLYTGLREGELCALQWDDVHIKEKYLEITKTVAEVEPGPGRPPPQSKSARKRKSATSTASSHAPKAGGIVLLRSHKRAQRCSSASPALEAMFLAISQAAKGRRKIDDHRKHLFYAQSIPASLYDFFRRARRPPKGRMGEAARKAGRRAREKEGRI